MPKSIAASVDENSLLKSVNNPKGRQYIKNS